MCERNVTFYISKHNGILGKWQTLGLDFTWPCCYLNGILPYCRVPILSGSSRNPIWSVHGFKRQRLSLWCVAVLCLLEYQTNNTFDSIDNKCLLVKESPLFEIVTSSIPTHQQAKRLRRFQIMYYKGFLILLKPNGHVTHHQFNIQQLYALPTLYLCVLYLSENKQRLVPLTA